MKFILLVNLVFVWTTNFAYALTKEQAEKAISKMILKEMKSQVKVEVLSISDPIDNIHVVAVNAPYREFPNIIIFKKGKVVEQGLSAGISSGSDLLDMHTQKHAIDFHLTDPVEGKVRKKVTQNDNVKIREVQKKAGGVHVDYGSFYHMHPRGKQFYYIDKTHHFEFAKKIFGSEKYKGFKKNTCANMADARLAQVYFKKEVDGKYSVIAKTNNDQLWMYQFEGIADNKNLDKLTVQVRANITFPLSTITYQLKFRPFSLDDKKPIFNTSLDAFGANLKWSGKVENFNNDDKFFIKSISNATQMEYFFTIFKKKVEMVENGKKYWVFIQDKILGFLQEDKRNRNRKQFYQLRLAGSFNNNPYLFMIDYQEWVSSEIKQTKCFAQKWRNFKIGMSYEKAKEQALKQGSFYKCMRQNNAFDICIYVLDKDKKNMLYLGTAGDFFKDKLYSIQIDGMNNKKIDLTANLKLGDSQKKIKKTMGEFQLGKKKGAYRPIFFENNRCSLELKDGVLGSYRIQGDPNFF